MTSTKKDPVLVVFQLTGANDYLNTIIPYNDPLYRDNRPVVGVTEERIIKIDDKMGFHPEMAPLKNVYDRGDMAVVHGIGYANSPRSHFRSMDIWHTCEPDKLGTEGWLGRATREIDPNKENVLTTVSFGPSLFRALALPGVPVAVVDDLDNYGLLPNIAGEQRNKVLDRFARMYSPAIGTGAVMDYMGQTGLDTLEGADILKEAPGMYSSEVEYPDTSIAKKLKGIAQVHMANFGTRIFYVDHGSFDSHSNQIGMHDKLWYDVSHAMDAFPGRPEGTRRRPGSRGPDVHRVRPPHPRQRLRHRPRRRRRGLHVRHQRQGRPVQRIPVHGGEGPGAGRRGPQQRLPRPVLHGSRGLDGPGRQAAGGRELREAPDHGLGDNSTRINSDRGGYEHPPLP